MKIIIAKRSGLDRIAYINANKINSFLAEENKYSGNVETRIYFSEGRCEIEGDRTQELLAFMLSDEDTGVLDLTELNNGKSSYWDKRKEKNDE